MSNLSKLKCKVYERQIFRNYLEVMHICTDALSFILHIKKNRDIYGTEQGLLFIKKLNELILHDPAFIMPYLVGLKALAKIDPAWIRTIICNGDFEPLQGCCGASIFISSIQDKPCRIS